MVSLETYINELCEDNPSFQAGVIALPDLPEKTIEVQPQVVKKYKVTPY